MLLDEYEEVAIKILVLLHTGSLKVTIGDIDLRTKVPRDMHDEFDYQLTNPLEHIPQNIMDFIDEHFYYETYPGAAPKYSEVNPRFWEASKIYNTYKNKILNHANKQPDQQSKPKGISAQDALALYNKKS